MSQPPYPGQPDPHQPWSGQPSSGQPYPGQQPASGQPYSGQQPASGQPYPGQQPYQGQPSSGQPYPSGPYTPGQANPYPGGGEQQYPPTQPYPASGAGQGGYPPPPQPDPYGAPGYPAMTPAPPPKKKSRTVPIVLVSIAVFLVLCVGGGTAIVLIARNSADSLETYVPPTPAPTVTRETDEPEPTPTRTTEAPPEKTITVVEPKTLGGRPKLTDEQFQGIADQLKDDLGKIPNATNTVGALYGRVARQDIVVIAGVAAPVDNPTQELNGTFLGAGVGGLKVTGITTVEPGPLGGVAKCGKADASGVDMVLCGWADDGSVGWIIWYFKSVNQVKGEFAKLRGQIEKSS